MNNTLYYPWKRVWIPLGTDLQNDHYGLQSTNHGKTLSELDDHPCIMLLGEPSVGKSTEIKHAIAKKGHLHCTYNLNSYSSEASLFGAIENLEVFKQWLNSTSRLYLYLDGLDEARLNIKTIHNAISDWIVSNKRKFRIVSNDRDGSKQPSSNILFESGLFLRITCRSASWSREISQNLEEAYGVGMVLNYELAPLDLNCVRVAAEIEDIDADEFLETISQQNAAVFAAEPVTFVTLIQLYKSEGLANHRISKDELFLQLCLSLCGEINSAYTEHAKLSSKERLIIASRIAVYVILSNRNSFWRHHISNNKDLLAVHFNDVAGDKFDCDEFSTTLNVSYIKETLDTGLFRMLDEERLEFRMKSIAEFLTAWHLSKIKVNVHQLRQLLTSPLDRLKVIPQLLEVAEWMVLMDRTAFDLLKNDNPFLILKSGRGFNIPERKEIVSRLIALSGSFEIADNSDFRRHYAKLAHPHLMSTLKNAIKKKKKNFITRRIAIDIAGACRVIGISADLNAIVRDETEEYFLRKQAANALAEFKGKNVDLFRELALTSNVSDSEDELKGVALNYLYPQHVTTKNVLSALTKVKRDNLFGSYRAFLLNLGNIIPEEDLDQAVEAIIETEHFFERESYGNFTDLLDRVLNRAVKYAQNGRTFNLISKMIFKLNEFRNFNIEFENDEKRKTFLSYLFDLDDGDKLNVSDLFYMGRNSVLLTSADWDWLINLLENETSEKKQKTIANILWMMLDFTSSRQVIQILETLFRYPYLLTVRPYYINAVELGSEEATKSRQAREAFATIKKREIQRKKKVVNFSVVNEVKKQLGEFSDKNLDAWWKIIFTLRVNESEGTFSETHDFEFEIIKLPGWKLLAEELKLKLIDIAQVYISRYKAQPVWITSNTFSRPDLAIYKSLLLLSFETRDTIDAITTEQWRDWHAVIIYCSLNTTNELPDIRKFILIKCADANIENAIFYSNLKQYLIFRLGQHGLYDLYKLVDIVNEKIAAVLLEVLVLETCTKENQDYILEILFTQRLKPVIDFCNNAILKLKSKQYNVKEKSILVGVAARILLNPHEGIWKDFWKIINGDSSLAKEIFIRAAPHLGYGESRQIRLLKTSQRLDVLQWLYKHFPPENDPSHSEAYIIAPLDTISDYRSQIIRSLIEEGSPESVEALKVIDKKLGLSDINFKWWTITARENMWRRTWVSPSPSELQAYLRQSSVRFVRTDFELLSIIEESLERLQKKLKGDNPTSYFLWNAHSNSRIPYTHKDENALSDFIKMHLDYDLIDRKIIINREVEIKRSTKNKDGERTDLLIQASARKGDAILKVVIEAKGCWNGDISTAMEEQLVTKYMSKYKSKAGIYLIGWYYCKSFQPHKAKNLDKVSKQYQLQAESLSSTDKKIKAIVLDCSL
jgi:hypothetical protein